MGLCILLDLYPRWLLCRNLGLMDGIPMEFVDGTKFELPFRAAGFGDDRRWPEAVK